MRIFKQILKFRIGLLHATFHRNMKRAEIARKQQNIIQFKQYIYAAEDAWKKLVTFKKKYNL